MEDNQWQQIKRERESIVEGDTISQLVDSYGNVL